MLFHICEVIPKDIPSLLNCCNPVPPLVRLYANDILKIIDESQKKVLKNYKKYLL